MLLPVSQARAQLEEPLARIVRAESIAPIQHPEVLTQTVACFHYAESIDPASSVPNVHVYATRIPLYCLDLPGPPFTAVYRPFEDEESWFPVTDDVFVCGEGFLNAGEAILGDDPYLFVASPRRLGTAFFLDYRGGTVAVDAGGAVSDSTAGESFTRAVTLSLLPAFCLPDGRDTAALAWITAWIGAGATEFWIHKMLYPRAARRYIREVFYSETALTYEAALAYTYTNVGRDVPIPDGTGGYRTDAAGVPLYELRPGRLQAIFPGYSTRRNPDPAERRDADVTRRAPYSCVEEITAAVRRRSNAINPKCEPFLACLTENDPLADPTCVSLFVADYATRTACWLVALAGEDAQAEAIATPGSACFDLFRCTDPGEAQDPACQALASAYIHGYLR